MHLKTRNLIYFLLFVIVSVLMVFVLNNKGGNDGKTDSTGHSSGNDLKSVVQNEDLLLHLIDIVDSSELKGKDFYAEYRVSAARVSFMLPDEVKDGPGIEKIRRLLKTSYSAFGLKSLTKNAYENLYRIKLENGRDTSGRGFLLLISAQADTTLIFSLKDDAKRIDTIRPDSVSIDYLRENNLRKIAPRVWLWN